MPENLVSTAITASVFNNENSTVTKADVMKQANPLNRKPLKKLENTPSNTIHNRPDKVSCEKLTWINDLEVDHKRGLTVSSLGRSVVSVPSDDNNTDADKPLYSNEHISFCNPTSKILNVSVDAHSSDESFDQCLENEHTVFRSLLLVPEVDTSQDICGGHFNSAESESIEEEDIFQLRLANPICEESYESVHETF